MVRAFPTVPRQARARRDPGTQLERIVRWYAARIYDRIEGGRVLPFYCDPKRVGAFAVPAAELARGDEDALFRLVIALAMYQSRRDVDIMAIQRSIRGPVAAKMVEPRRLRVLVERHPCSALKTASSFDNGCDVRRSSTSAVCARRPRTVCHVKEATAAIGRMGDMGKIPTSVWLHLTASGGFSGLLEAACAETRSPADAADVVVRELAKIHRIGVKLATMIVSALSVPSIASGVAPWWPRLDGNHLVVVDANVARTIDALRARGPRTHEAYANWFRRHAGTINLRAVRTDWPERSPRIVQQAVYWFRSRSNRAAVGDTCAVETPCEECITRVCPFV